MQTYERALALALDQGDPPLRGTADMYVGMSELHRERGNLDTAADCLARSHALGEHTGFPQHPYRRRVALARLRVAHGDLEGALALLDEAESRYVGDFFPNVRPVAALKARVWIAQGRVDDALAWARRRELSVDDEPAYLREFEHLTLARILIARARSGSDARAAGEAVRLLDHLLSAAETGERTGSVIEILILRALAEAARGDLARAVAALARALTLAKPEGYVRIFLDEGESMRDLLRRIPAPYARQLLATSGSNEPAPASATAPAAGLLEPLTARELEILRLIAAGLRNQEIADRLFISLPTVKRHIANAYGKLGAGHRTEALARAGDLNLL
jgi:LuxR family maltose regulon positive regulatory protein